MHFVSDLFKQILTGPRLCIPGEKKKKETEKNAKNAEARFIGNTYIYFILDLYLILTV